MTINDLSKGQLLDCFNVFLEIEFPYLRAKYLYKKYDYTGYAICEIQRQLLTPGMTNEELLETLSIRFCEFSLIYQSKRNGDRHQFFIKHERYSDPFFVCHDILEEFIDYLINNFGFGGIK